MNYSLFALPTLYLRFLFLLFRKYYIANSHFLLFQRILTLLFLRRRKGMSHIVQKNMPWLEYRRKFHSRFEVKMLKIIIIFHCFLTNSLELFLKRCFSFPHYFIIITIIIQSLPPHWNKDNSFDRYLFLYFWILNILDWCQSIIIYDNSKKQIPTVDRLQSQDHHSRWTYDGRHLPCLRQTHEHCTRRYWRIQNHQNQQNWSP